jgi:hypothetical protein
LLTSSDQDKVKEGMEQVSNILPFLMMGGFSQSEIVAYLKAKQEAAQEVAKSITVEEESQVSVNAPSAHAVNTMSASVEAGSSSSADTDDESPISSVSTTNTTMINPVSNSQPNINVEIMNMVNLKMPKLQDIAKFETRALKNDETRTAEVKKVQTVLGKIANPGQIADAAERTQFEQVRETLLDERQKGNATANVLLNASLRVQGNPAENIKSMLAQIADPSLAKGEADKKRFTELHDSMSKASEEGNELAKSILATHEKTSIEDIKKLSDKLKEEKAKGEPIAKSVLDNLGDTDVVPGSNQLQPVSDADYDEVKKLWEENYRSLPVPAAYGTEATGRIDWIKADIKTIEETIALLTTNDTEKEQQGMQRVSEILPMLMLGGFSQNEIIGYLKAKVEAGNTVMAELQKEEEGKVSVDSNTQQEAASQEMKANVEEEKKEGESKS